MVVSRTSEARDILVTGTQREIPPRFARSGHVVGAFAPATNYFWYIVAAKLLRPLDRRLRRTFLPPGVAIRARNPWVLMRLILDGWNVHFMAVPQSSDYLLFTLESLQISECSLTPVFSSLWVRQRNKIGAVTQLNADVKGSWYYCWLGHDYWQSP